MNNSNAFDVTLKNGKIESDSKEFKDLVGTIPETVDRKISSRIYLRKLHLWNFCRHSDVEIDFTDANSPNKLSCLVGPNGTGKTTILNAIQLMFDNYSMYDQDRYEANMSKYVRNIFNMLPSQAKTSDFSVIGEFETNGKPYEVEVTKKKIVKWHPPEVNATLLRHCYVAKFDQDLRIFQLRRRRWEMFKKLFRSVTGFDVEEVKNLFDDTYDTRMKKVNEEYVTTFSILNKSDDVFTNRGMSAGERKITKCFSTIYNLDVQPSIILIDNITDHVELDRHLPLMAGMEECFPESQLVVTCHSMPVQRNFDRKKIYDMRFFGATEDNLKFPWKMRIKDELNDAIDRVNFSKTIESSVKEELTKRGEYLKDSLSGIKEENSVSEGVVRSIEDFLSEIYKYYIVKGLMVHPPIRMSGR